MTLYQQFMDIAIGKTRDGFHDASLECLSIDCSKKCLTIIISHYRNSIDEREEALIFSRFLFGGTKKIKLDNEMESFINDDEIASFIASSNIDGDFKMVGNTGWILSFSAESIQYSEDQVSGNI